MRMKRNLPMHNALEPVCWLEGKWSTIAAAHGRYPTKDSFTYCEDMMFTSIGQPMFNYEAQSWHPQTQLPMHREVGFLKVIPDTNKVIFVLSHTFGLTTIEEGVVNGYEIKVESTSIGRMSEGNKGPTVIKTRREFTIVRGWLEQIIYVATALDPEMTLHLHARYTKVLDEV